MRMVCPLSVLKKKKKNTSTQCLFGCSENQTKQSHRKYCTTIPLYTVVTKFIAWPHGVAQAQSGGLMKKNRAI